MTSDSEENKDIAIKFFKALSSGSETYLNYYNDDAIIWTAGDNSIGGTRTKQEIVDFAQGILSAFPDGIKFTITGITAENERVAVEVSGEAMTDSGKNYNNKYNFFFKLKNGKILELHEYMDNQIAAKIIIGA